jgi:hypothetical protein
MGVDHDDAGGDVVKRPSYDGGFPSKLPELELNLGRSAKWSQQLIQPLEVGCAKWLYANSFVNTKNDGVRPGIGDLSGLRTNSLYHSFRLNSGAGNCSESLIHVPS